MRELFSRLRSSFLRNQYIFVGGCSPQKSSPIPAISADEAMQHMQNMLGLSRLNH